MKFKIKSLIRSIAIKIIFSSITSVLISLFIFVKIQNMNLINKEKRPYDNIQTIVWKFGRADGSVISEKIRLQKDGKIIGYQSANEKTWGKKNGVIVFYNANKVITTKFEYYKKFKGGWFLSGTFLLDSGITHTLKEVERSNVNVEPILFIAALAALILLTILSINEIKRIYNAVSSFLGLKRIRVVAFYAILSTAILALLAIIFIVPPNMDEYLPYHQIARFFYPNSVEHTFREPCDDSFDIKVFGVKLPLRSYPYCGFSEGLRYLPFFLISRSYISARIMKLILILFMFYSIIRLTKIPSIYVLALMLFNLPLMFQMLIDTGPVAYQICLTALIPFLLSRTKNVAVACAVGALVYFGFETKAIFAISLIPISIITLIYIWEDFFKSDKKAKIKIIIRLSSAVLVFLTLSIVTFTGKTKSGDYYFKSIIGRPAISVFNLAEQTEHFKNNLAIYFKSFLNFGHRVFQTENKSDFFTTFILSLYLALIASALTVFIKRKTLNKNNFLKYHSALAQRFFKDGNSGETLKITSRRKPIFDFIYRGRNKSIIDKINIIPDFGKDFALFLANIISFIFVTWFVNRSSESWAGHHIILSFPFLIMALIYAVKIIRNYFPKFAVIMVTIAVVANIITGVNLLKRSPHPTDDRSKIKILNYLDDKNLSKNNIYVVIDWGMYYIQSLYGRKDQTVLYIDPLENNSQVDSIKEIAKKLNKNVIFILRKESDYHKGLSVIKKNFDEVDRIRTANLLSDDLWQIWRVNVK